LVQSLTSLNTHTGSKNMRKLQSFVAAGMCGLLFANSMAAQALLGTIVGRVTESGSGKPIAMAYIQVLGTRRSAHTRADGSFIVDSVPVGPVTLRVRRIGYGMQSTIATVDPQQRVSVSVALKEDFRMLDDLVVTGPSRRDDSTAFASALIKLADAPVGLLTNPTHLLTARVAGVNVVQHNGEPGANAQVRIRGGSSIGGNNEPLYVIDGVPVQNAESEARGFGIGGTPALGRNPLNAINPSDIDSITVLKDISATAQYGIRGANGVVLIATKNGAPGRFTAEFATYLAIGSRATSLGFLNGDQYRTFLSQQVAAGRVSPTRLAAQGTANTDWEQAIARTSLSQNHDLSFGGGSQRSTFRASVNFADQQGVVLSSGFNRLQARFNGTHQAFSGKLRLGLNFSSARIENDYLPYENTGGFEGGVFQNMSTFNPTRPVYNASPAAGFFEVGPGAQGARNPVALANQIRDDGRTTRTIGAIAASYAFVPSVTARLSVGVDQSDGKRNGYLPSSSPVGAAFNGLAQQSTRTVASSTLLGMLTWAPSPRRDIDFDVSTGFEYNEFSVEDFVEEARDFAAGVDGYRNLRAGRRQQPLAASLYDGQIVSLLTTANAAYKQKYVLSGVLRRDGLSTLGDDRAWELAPAVSAAWVLSRESFAEGLPFSLLRLRAGYGEQCGRGLVTSLAPSGSGGTTTIFGAPQSKCERTSMRNVAIDYATSASRLTGSLEFYRRSSTNLLLNVPLPPPAFGTGLQDVGASSHTGVEFSIDAQLARGKVRGFALTSGLVLSAERNKVLDVGPTAQFINTSDVSGQGQSGVRSQRIIPGQPLGTFFGARFAGFNAAGNQTFVKYNVTRDAQGKETSRVANGVTSNPTGDDFVVIGNANPNFSLGLRSNASWKGFDASWLWRMEQGRDVFNNTALASSSKSNALQDRNFLRSALSTPESVFEPVLYSSRWIEDGSFIRLQNVTLGYSFTLPFTDRPIRAYVAGDNLLLFTRYTGYDPEVFVDAGLASRGVDYLAYPRARTLLTGLRIRF
jgi:TonB-dependent starch-binding outer membrane protein SusC